MPSPPGTLLLCSSSPGQGRVQFQEEMNFITQALGVTCGTCHVRGNFASDEKPEKLTARRMLEMTKVINKQFFPDHTPKTGESVLELLLELSRDAGKTLFMATHAPEVADRADRILHLEHGKLVRDR